MVLVHKKLWSAMWEITYQVQATREKWQWFHSTLNHGEKYDLVLNLISYERMYTGLEVIPSTTSSSWHLSIDFLDSIVIHHISRIKFYH